MIESADAGAIRVLVVDDEPQIRRALDSILSVRGYHVTCVDSGEKAVVAVAADTCDLVILDLTLPGMSGLDVCRAVRGHSSLPILVLSVRDTEADKVAALDLGADDYLSKPFSAPELLARIRALIRRSAASPAPGVLRTGELAVDVARRQVWLSDTEVHLTRTEFDILAVLIAHDGAVVTSRAILTRVWGEQWADDASLLRVHVSHLRKKIEPDPSVPRFIITEPGVGFRFAGGE